MNRRLKLLTLSSAALVVSLILGALVWQAAWNNNDQNSRTRVACIGDSITAGFHYPDYLWMLLGSNYTVRNFGVGGSSISLKSGTPYMNQSAFQQAKHFEPNVIIIMLGTNDASPSLEQYIGDFADTYVKLVDELKGIASKPRIWIVKPPPIFNDGTGLSTEFFNKNVIPNIELAANKTNIPIIDAYSALYNHSEYFFDGVHPNMWGSQTIAKVIYNAIISK